MKEVSKGHLKGKRGKEARKDKPSGHPKARRSPQPASSLMEVLHVGT